MAYAYSTKITENSAKAVGLALPISRKQSTQVCSAIRGLNLQKAKKLLEDAMALKRPIEMKKYNRNTGHKAGMGPGSYAPTTCDQILKILKNAEANAQFKGLSTGNLIITHASAQKGPTVMHNGRQRAKAKRTHIELIVEEIKKQDVEVKKVQVAKK